MDYLYFDTHCIGHLPTKFGYKQMQGWKVIQVFVSVTDGRTQFGSLSLPSTSVGSTNTVLHMKFSKTAAIMSLTWSPYIIVCGALVTNGLLSANFLGILVCLLCATPAVCVGRSLLLILAINRIIGLYHALCHPGGVQHVGQEGHKILGLWVLQPLMEWQILQITLLMGRKRYTLGYFIESFFSFECRQILVCELMIYSASQKKRKPINQVNFSENCNDLSKKSLHCYKIEFILFLLTPVTRCQNWFAQNRSLRA